MYDVFPLYTRGMSSAIKAIHGLVRGGDYQYNMDDKS